MRAGDTFKFSPAASSDKHLWVVISDPESYPDDLVVIVSLTSHDLWKDPACVLSLGDHPFIRHETSVYYAKARFVSRGRLDHLVEVGDVIPNTPMEPEVLARIRRGAGDSDFIKEGFHKALVAQALVD